VIDYLLVICFGQRYIGQSPKPIYLTIFLSPLLIPGHPRPGNFFVNSGHLWLYLLMSRYRKCTKI